MDDVQLRALLESVNVIAVVGCSTDPSKAAHDVPEQLQRAGYRIIPVHPSADEILGEKAYPTLADIPEPVDLVDVFRPGPQCAGIARQAIDIGAPAIWLQLGITNDEARDMAQQAGVTYVENRCLKVDVQRLGIVKHAVR